MAKLYREAYIGRSKQIKNLKSLAVLRKHQELDMDARFKSPQTGNQVIRIKKLQMDNLMNLQRMGQLQQI